MKQEPALTQRVAAFVRQYKLVAKGCRVVVAVSGGPDSVCLLHLLTELREKLGIELHAAHLDHQLRGEESAADAAYVEKLVAAWTTIDNRREDVKPTNRRTTSLWKRRRGRCATASWRIRRLPSVPIT
jgi:tRNA(Ile)-lysidine synthase TilS/MesJ